MAKATLLLDYKSSQGHLVLQMVLWQLPKATPARPHGLKYRLYLGVSGETLVRYDNESAKGDHRHVGKNEAESPYAFVSLEQLIEDFRADCEANGWRWE